MPQSLSTNKGTVSYSRQEYEAELAAGKARRKLPSGETEAAIQAVFIEWIDLMIPRFPDLELLFAIPNEGHYSKKDGWKRKLTGRRSGVPDINLPLPSADGKFIGLWVEFKSATGVVSKEQKAWHEKLRRRGHRVEVFRSWTAAANAVIDHLKLSLEKL